jgi:hypothetical protein
MKKLSKSSRLPLKIEEIPQKKEEKGATQEKVMIEDIDHEVTRERDKIVSMKVEEMRGKEEIIMENRVRRISSKKGLNMGAVAVRGQGIDRDKGAKREIGKEKEVRNLIRGKGIRSKGRRGMREIVERINSSLKKRERRRGTGAPRKDKRRRMKLEGVISEQSKKKRFSQKRRLIH